VVRTRASGFTLIELAVTLGVMAFLLLVGLPFLSGWVDGVRQLRARNQVLEGMGQVRALALRNPGALAEGQPIATLRRVGNDLQVMLVGVEMPVWSATLDDKVQLMSTSARGIAGIDANGEGQAFRCVAFNSRGMRLPGAANCVLSLGDERIAVGVDGQEPVYVEIL
jgi:prepilin-type N-terminal cleavage/methylation domain-containing protein